MQGNPGDVTSKDGSGNTPLHLAALNGQREAVRTLMVLGSHVNQRNLEGETPLHLAAEAGHEGVVRILLDSGADPTMQDNHGATPCHLAASGGHLEIMELMSLRSNNTGMDITEKIKQLHLAATNGWQMPLEDFIHLGLPLNSKNERGETALYLTVRNGHENCAEILLEAGADPNISRDDGSTILHAAAFSGMIRLIEQLTINSRPIHNAIRVLPERRQEIPVPNPTRNQRRQWQDIYKVCDNIVLTDSDGDGNSGKECEYQLPAIEEYLTTLFHSDTCEVESKLNDLREYLQEVLQNLCKRMDVTTNLGRGATLLHLAAVCRAEETVEVLLQRGANIRARNMDGVTPLIMACAGGSVEVVEALVRAGADPKDVDDRGRTALHYAVRLKSLEMTKYLLELGVDPNHKDVNGNTPLHIAAVFGSGPAFIFSLREAKADLSARNNERLYPFSLAKDPVSFKILQPPGFNFEEMITPFVL